ncbi:MAG: hypothetical protein ACKVOE_00845 [Rickettsiales bacterium]
MYSTESFVLPPMNAEPRLRTHTIADDASRIVQASLFASSFLPRQLPAFKHGPEDEARATRH